MTFPHDDQPSKQSSDEKAQEAFQAPGLEEPPSSFSAQTGSIDSGGVPSPANTTFKTKPTNFLALYNGRGTIQGQFVIDPSIQIPDALLSPLGTGETEDDRKNLSLRSEHGSVRAEIWLIASASAVEKESAIDAHKPRRTTIALTADHESIHAQLHAIDGVAPFSLTARAPHGSIRVALPRSFQGLLSLSSLDGNISLSDTLVQNATQLGQVGTMRRYFIGDFHLLGKGEWEGDQAKIDAHDSIQLKYVDEGMDAQDIKGLLSGLLEKGYSSIRNRAGIYSRL